MKHNRGRKAIVWAAALLGPAALLVGATTMEQVQASARPVAHGSMAGMSMAQMAQMARDAAARKPHTVVLLHRKVVQITIHNFAFSPASVEVSPGTRIEWTNTDDDPHTVDSTKNVWTSEALDTNGHFARRFTKAGTFPYYCSIHPFMHGTVIVKQ